MSRMSVLRSLRPWLLVALLLAVPLLRATPSYAEPPLDGTGNSWTQVNTLGETDAYAQPTTGSEVSVTLDINTTAYVVAKKLTSTGWWFQLADIDGKILGWVPLAAVEVVSVVLIGPPPNVVDVPGFIPIPKDEPTAPPIPEEPVPLP